MSYNNNWVNELKESYLEEKKARQVVNEEYRRPKPQGKPVQVKPATGKVGEIAAGIAQRGREELTKKAKAMAQRHMIKRYGKGKVTFESHSGGHFVEHESEGGDAYAHTVNPETGKISNTPHVTSSYYGESVTILDQMHLGRRGTYDHVEHKGNSLQEEMALNEHLLMLIDVLCEELGIDVETLLENADPVLRFSSASKGAGASKGASSSTPDTSKRKQKIRDEIAVIKHRISPHGNERERDPASNEFYALERRLEELQKELSGLS